MSALQSVLPNRCFLCGTMAPAAICEPCLLAMPLAPKLRQDIPYLDTCLSLALYDGNIKKVLHEVKFENNRNLAYLLSRFLFLKHPNWMMPPCDYVMPVPIDKRRRRKRGFNQVEIIFETWVSNVAKGKWVKGLYRRSTTKALYRLGKAQRKTELMNVFAIESSLDLQGKVVVVVDDVVTSGATLSEIARCLKKKGASHVYAYTLCYQPL